MSLLGSLWWVPIGAAAAEVRSSAPFQGSPGTGGYWMLGRDGSVYPFGEAADHGALPDGVSAATAMTPTPTGRGYWIVVETGVAFAFGDASFGPAGDSPPFRAGERWTAIAATPSGNGLWRFSDRGRVFATGDATHFGDMSAIALDGPVIAAAATPTGRGYYMVGSDGGIFAFGDAAFHGSVPGVLPGVTLDQPVVGIAPSPTNRGYWLVAADGGVFSFGDAPFRNSIPGVLPGVRLDAPVNGMVAYGDGYLMVASDGGIFNFSNRDFLGSLGGADSPPDPIVGVTPFPAQLTVPSALESVEIDASPTSPRLMGVEYRPNGTGITAAELRGTRSGPGGRSLRVEDIRFDHPAGPVSVALDVGGRHALSGPDGTVVTITGATATTVTVRRVSPGGATSTEVVPVGGIQKASGAATREQRLAGTVTRVYANGYSIQPVVRGPGGSPTTLGASGVGFVRGGCRSTAAPSFGCDVSLDRSTPGHILVQPWVDVPRTEVAFETREDCDDYNTSYLGGETSLLAPLGKTQLTSAVAALLAAYFTSGASIYAQLAAGLGAGAAANEVSARVFSESCGSVTTAAGVTERTLAELAGRPGLAGVLEVELVSTTHLTRSSGPLPLTLDAAFFAGNRPALPSFTVARKVPLRVTVAPSSQRVDVGQSASLSAVVVGGIPTEFGGDGVYQLTADWGRGLRTTERRTFADHEAGVEITIASPPLRDPTPASAPLGVAISVSTNGGAETASGSAGVAVRPDALAVSLDGVPSGEVGRAVQLVGSVAGGVEPYVLEVDWGDGTTSRFPNTTAGAFTVRHTYQSLPDGPVTVTAVDDDDVRATQVATPRITETVNVSRAGSVSANSNYGFVRFRPGNAVDGSTATSWYSAGPFAPPNEDFPAIYTWKVASPVRVSRIVIDGPSAANFGFDRGVAIQVESPSGGIVEGRFVRGRFTRGDRIVVDIPEGPDGLPPLASEVQLRFFGHESADCGGFSELTITAVRASWAP